MNLQSDHGYVVSGLERRTRELARKQANFCRTLAAKAQTKPNPGSNYTPSFWRDRARVWLAIGRRLPVMTGAI